MTVHVFLSFDSDDLDLVNLFRGQAKNENSDLEFADYSVKDPINSEDDPYLKQEIKEKIKQSSIVVCLVGESTHRSSWVEWELETGHDLDKCLIGVRLRSDHNDIVPRPLLDHDAEVLDWIIQDVMDAIDRC